MLFSLQHIFFHQIEFTGKWNIHPWDDNCYSEKLKSSVIRTGIIHPPFLLQQPDGQLEVITGHKRLSIADNHLESEKIACFVLPENFPQKEIPDLLLTDQSETVLSLAEKARFIQIASRCMGKEEILRKFSKRLEIRDHASAIDEFEQLIAMDTEIIKEIHSGRLQYKMVGELLRIKDPEDRLALVALFRNLSLGGGKQKKLFSLIRDLAYRKKSSISDFLKEDELQQILNHEEMNPPQKAQHLGNFLQAKLTPAYLESENKFTSFSKDLQLPENVSLSHSQSFETDALTLSIAFKNSKECQRLLPEIKSVLKRKKKVL